MRGSLSLLCTAESTSQANVLLLVHLVLLLIRSRGLYISTETRTQVQPLKCTCVFLSSASLNDGVLQCAAAMHGEHDMVTLQRSTSSIKEQRTVRPHV